MIGQERAAPQRRGPGLGALLSQLVAEARSLVGDYAELAVLDARRAAIRLAWLLASGLVVAVLVVTAWLACVAGAIVFMLGEGASWIMALGVAALLNLIGAGALVGWMRHLVLEMPFTALLRQLRGDPPAKP
jgi:hypothetical protein